MRMHSLLLAMTRLAASILLGSSLAASASTSAVALTPPTQDPLFQRMLGDWDGEGIRTQTVSGHLLHIQTHSTATLKGDKLISHNEITETPVTSSGAPNGTPKIYIRDYWVRATSLYPEAAFYELGHGEGAEAKVTSQGRLASGIFEVEETIGSDPELVIRAVTQFKGSSTVYNDTVYYGDRKISEAEIRYHRTAVSAEFSLTPSTQRN